MFRFHIIFSMICWCGYISVHAQSNDPYKPQIRTYTPATPNAASLGKFGEYPVDFSSGLVDISIPLYEIKSSRINVPLTLKYHPSGIKAGDQASCVGLGWALQGGGMISRNVRDKIDEFNGYLKSYNSIKSPTVLNPDQVLDDYNYLKSFSQTGIYPLNDAEPDVFSYNLLNKSGQFFFDKDKINTVTIPYDKVKISYGANFSSFTILDTDGTTYIYGQSLGGTGYTEDAFIPTGIGDITQSASTGWMLTTIISADKADTVQFAYSGDRVQYDYGITDRVEVWDKHAGGGSGNQYQFPSSQWGVHQSTSNTLHFDGTQQTLQQITFKNGKVVFEKDLRQDAGSMGQKINRMVVYSLDAATNNYIKVKSISFYYDYFTGYKRLKLNSLSINGENDDAIQNYSFSYNGITPPGPTTKAIDNWGYYNGRLGNTTLLQDSYITDGAVNDPGSYTGSVGASDREPDLTYAQSCILTTINFPTGGHTDFSYELNKYSEPNLPDKFAGGLRIQQVKSSDATGSAPVVKTYVYGENESGTGKLVTPINFWAYYVTLYNLIHFDYGKISPSSPSESIRVRNYNSSPLTGLTGMDGRIVYYQYVSEYNGTPSSNIGKTIYKFDYTGDTYLYYTPTKGKYFRQNYSWKRGHLLEKTFYTAFNKPISKLENIYDQINQQWFGDVGYVINDNFHVTDNSYTSASCSNSCTPYQYAGIYSYNTFSVETGNYKLTKTNEYNYDQRDVTKVQKQQTNYEYDASIYEPSKITKYNNDNYEVLNYKYPLNYNTDVTSTDPSVMGLQYLKSINNLTQVVETYKQKYKTDNTYTGTTEASLTQFKSTAPLPEIIYKLERPAPSTSFIPSSISGTVFTKDANYKPYIQFNNYLNGNLVQQQKVNDVFHSYIWDYNNAIPVAEVSNSNSSEIAYTSFEGDGGGNWSNINKSNIINDIRALSGTKLYNFNGSALSKSGLNSSTMYIVSYWSNSGAYSVSGISVSGWPKSLNSIIINGITWTLWEHKISGTGTISVSGTGSVDELRLYPANSQMTTYTYKPLIGLSSMSDINNNINYYEYDTFGRLKLIKDIKGNITKTFNYKYQSVTP